jgi:hypothetical protein
MDAYEMLNQVRNDVGELTEVHWSDLALLRKLNFETLKLWMQLGLQAGDILLKSATVTFASSEVALPSDCDKPIYLENGDGYAVPISLTVREKNLFATAPYLSYNLNYSAYLQGETLKLNQAGISGNWTLWYYGAYKDMAYGTGGASCGASALHFDAAKQPSIVDDYYNTLTVNTYNSSTGARKLTSTISDYTGSTLVAVVTGTPAAGDIYGTENQLPIQGHWLVVQRVILSCLSKPSAAIDPKYFEYTMVALKDYEATWNRWIETRIPGSRAVRITAPSE